MWIQIVVVSVVAVVFLVRLVVALYDQPSKSRN
jgi:Na+/pantothenate symporter